MPIYYDFNCFSCVRHFNSLSFIQHITLRSPRMIFLTLLSLYASRSSAFMLFCSVYVFPCVGFRPHSFNITRTTTRKSWRKKQIPMFLESWTLNFCAMGFGLRLWSERKRFNVLYLSRSELVLFILTFFFYLIPKLRKHSLKMYLFFYHFAVRVDTKSAYDINYIDGYGVVVADAYTK